jgi:Mn2+/Fe2+ NRAMP family transporter
MSTAKRSAILGAAFLMATSAIGPGFLTQTTVFTSQLLANFGFVILISILLDIGAQLNIWRVLAITEMRAQNLANNLLPGLGHFLAALIVLGGLAFNIANFGGCGLGLNVLTGWDVEIGAIISCVLALLIFWLKEFGNAMDNAAKVLGVIMIVLTVYIAIVSNPPVVEAVHRTFIPEKIDMLTIVTLVGGTVGGYISFSGAHRLLDAGIKGPEYLPQINRSAVSGIVITGVMRTVLFLAALGVVMGGVILTKENPAASVFQSAGGNIGYKFFGIVMWIAAITSVVGCAYTSVSFLRGFHPFIDKHLRGMIAVFIIISTIGFVLLGNPVKLLIGAGAINGLILPIALAVILIAARHTKLVGTYKHPLWMLVSGWIVVALMSYMGGYAILNLLKG